MATITDSGRLGWRFQRSSIYTIAYVPLTHVLEKESRFADPRASGSCDMFPTASYASSRAFYFISVALLLRECITVFPMKQKRCNHTNQRGCTSFMFFSSSFLYSSIIYSLYILIPYPRGCASDKSPHLQIFRPRIYLRCGNIRNVSSISAPILSPPRCRPYAPCECLNIYGVISASIPAFCCSPSSAPRIPSGSSAARNSSRNRRSSFI